MTFSYWNRKIFIVVRLQVADKLYYLLLKYMITCFR